MKKYNLSFVNPYAWLIFCIILFAAFVADCYIPHYNINAIKIYDENKNVIYQNDEYNKAAVETSSQEVNIYLSNTE